MVFGGMFKSGLFYAEYVIVGDQESTKKNS